MVNKRGKLQKKEINHIFTYLCRRRIVLSRFGYQSEESPGRRGRRAVESTGSRKVTVCVTENNRSEP